jgi:hypothetical protein
MIEAAIRYLDDLDAGTVALVFIIVLSFFWLVESAPRRRSRL